jgi:hypothetical protein
MNLQNILSKIETSDPEVYDRLDTRRNAMQRFAKVSGKFAMASIPFALGSMFKTAYGQSTSTVNDVLNFALTLEYLEAEFYTNIVGSPGFLTAPAAAQGALTKIRDDENKHVAFLKSVLGTNAIPKPTFDFSAGGGSGTGPFADYLINYNIQLAMAQTFEDTGVRAYKGQAPAVQSNRTVLTAALSIHSVEARHASHIRQMRRAVNVAIPSGQVVKPWITLDQSGIDFPPANSAIQMSYAGEEAVTQAGVTITGIAGNADIDAAAASASFDEPLTTQQVIDIVTPFFG